MNKLNLQEIELHLAVVQDSHYSLDSAESMIKVLKAVPHLINVVKAALKRGYSYHQHEIVDGLMQSVCKVGCPKCAAEAELRKYLDALPEV